jgi:hypothetical protein
MRQPRLPQGGFGGIHRLHCTGQVLHPQLDFAAEHPLRRLGDRLGLDDLRPFRTLLRLQQDVANHLFLDRAAYGGHAPLECLELDSQLRARLDGRLARLVDRRPQGFDPVEQRGDLADRLDDQCLACGARRLHAALPSAADGAVSAARAKPRASKQASSSGSTPLARRRVASFCARSNLSSKLAALAISAL